MKRYLISIAFFLAGSGGVALAQNSDLGLLLGVSLPSAEVSPSRVHSSVGASGQINYAYQILGTSAGDLYLEFPVLMSAGEAADVSRVGAARSVVASQGVTILFTPGVRFKLPVHSRLSLYGAAGAGVGAFGGNQVVVGAGGVNGGRSASPALGFGGGVDIRLTRLLSVRGEVRDFVTLGGLGGTVGRNRVIGQGGFAFHF